MRVLVVQTIHNLDQEQQSDVASQLGYALKKGVIEDVLFIPTKHDERVYVVDLKPDAPPVLKGSQLIDSQ